MYLKLFVELLDWFIYRFKDKYAGVKFNIFMWGEIIVRLCALEMCKRWQSDSSQIL